MDVTGMIKDIWNHKSKRKSYLIALLLAGLYLVDIFYLSEILVNVFGIAGQVLHEMVLAGMGVGVFLIFHGKMKVIFPFRKPEWTKLLGTVFLWLGTYLLTIMITMIVTYFFPEQVVEANEGVQELIAWMPFLTGVFVIALVPAICEEIAFRGALLGCFRGTEKKWIGILLVSLFFGACHGSIWRMIPTAMLGAAMGYLLLETDNMIYNMVFHFINNAWPVCLMGLLTKLLEVTNAMDETGLETMEGMVDSVRIPLASVGMNMIYAGAGPMLIYIGNYFLHRGQKGYDRGLFPPEKKKKLIILVGISLGIAGIGIFLVAVSVILEIAANLRSVDGLFN